MRYFAMSSGIDHEIRRAYQIVPKGLLLVLRQLQTLHRPPHVAEPGVALPLADRERRVPHPQPGMSLLTGVRTGTAPVLLQEHPQPVCRCVQIRIRVERPQHRIVRHARVELVDQLAEGRRAADRLVEGLVRLRLRRLGSRHVSDRQSGVSVGHGSILPAGDPPGLSGWWGSGHSRLRYRQAAWALSVAVPKGSARRCRGPTEVRWPRLSVGEPTFPGTAPGCPSLTSLACSISASITRADGQRVAAKAISTSPARLHAPTTTGTGNSPAIAPVTST